jgi:serine/threonine-protein kinase
MTQPDRCATCGRELADDTPRGLCPACLLRAAAAAGSTINIGAETAEFTADATLSAPVAPAGGTPETIRYIGDYELFRLIGRGGMGAVYEARQLSLHRPVAVKLVRAGDLASAAERDRFRAEAEAVASLDHPNLVEIFEVGEHQGQPYFSMKLYTGGSLEKRLSEYTTDSRKAARLMVSVADAVHHAHQRSILHRDLKPSNVLLDDRGAPHVTDFGLAKRIDDVETPTMTGAVLGTPQFMSPEQTTGVKTAITTASDVYGLGAILYALLAGRPPFMGLSAFDTMEKVRQEEPATPQGVDRDLVTICLTCLAKEPKRRYASAAAVADDLRNWLDHRPIHARRVHGWERAVLWTRRRPTAAALVALLALTIVAGLAGVGTQWYRAEKNLRDARRAEANERAARLRAESRFALALAAVKNSYSSILENSWIMEPDRDGSRSRVLRRAAEYYKTLQASLEDDSKPAAQAQLAAAYTSRGISERHASLPEEAVRSFEAASAVLEALSSQRAWRERALTDLTWALGNIAALKIHRQEPREGLALHRRVLEIRQRLRAEHPEVKTYRLDHAWVLQDLAITHMTLGQPDLAADCSQRACEELEALVPGLQPGPLRWDALSRLAQCLDSLTRVEYARKNFDTMTRASARALEVAEALARGDLDDPRHRELLANLGANYSRSLAISGDTRGARQARERAIEVFRELARTYPGSIRIQSALARCLYLEAWLCFNLGDLPEALAAAQESRELRETLHRGSPADEVNAGFVFEATVLEAHLLYHNGRSSEARLAANRAERQAARLTGQSGVLLYNLACALALGSSGASTPDGAERAMAALKRSVAAGFRDESQMRSDTDLAPLRHRADFQAMLLDLAFPTDPFRY